jgi:hypothetical protein
MGEITVDLGDRTTVYRSPRTRTIKGFLHGIAKDRRIRQLEEENRRLNADLQSALGKLYDRI